MATQLTAEQRHDLQEHGNHPVPVVDPITNSVYFIVAGDLFERFKALFNDEPFDIRETYVAQESALSKVWDDPALDVYNEDAPLQH